MTVDAPTITDNRSLTVERATGRIEWHVHEFDGGRAYMLNATSGSVQFSAHFAGEQWAEFQKLVAGAGQ